MVVEEAYLLTGYDAVAATYGTVDGYLRDGLGLDDQSSGTAPFRLLVVTDAAVTARRAAPRVAVVVAVQAVLCC